MALTPATLWSLGIIGTAASLLIGPAIAQSLPACNALKDQRDTIAAVSMTAELELARRYRERLCPELSRKADAANANTRIFPLIDYQALIDCRRQAEQKLEKEQTVLYRNSLGFTFYTQPGAASARQADRIRQQINEGGCQP